ncbi:glycosyltransferase family 4 protein [Halosimplex sp. J119]
MDHSTHVVVLLTGATEGNTPLETAATTQTDDVQLDVWAWGSPQGTPYGLSPIGLNAASRFDPRGYYQLYQRLKSVRPDLLHVHPIAVGAGATVIASLLDIPVIKTEHNPHTAYGPVKTLINAASSTLREVVVSNSQATNDSFPHWERKLLNAANTTRAIIPYGTNLDRIDHAIDSRDPPELPSGFIIGSGGRLVPQKNLSTLIDAIAGLVAERNTDDIHLVLTGDGPRRVALESRARAQGVSDHVHFLGWLPDQADVYAFYNAIDVFAFPSHYEGFGMANAEAMAAGTPVITNDIPVLREVVGDAGVLVDASDEDCLIDALESLYDDSEQREALAQQARERIAKLFTASDAAEEYARLYEDITNGEL